MIDLRFIQIHKAFLKHLFFVGVFLVLAVGQSFGQYKSDGLRFEIDEVKGCAPLIVNVTDLSGAAAILYAYVDDQITFAQALTGPTVTNTNHTFDQPGKYKIFQAIQGSADGDSILIEVFDLITPEFTAIACAGNNVLVDIIDTNYDQYSINYGDGNPSIIFNKGDVIPPYTYAPPIPNPNIAVQGRFIGAANNCGIDTEIISTFNITPPAKIIKLTTSQSDGKIILEYTTDPQITYRLLQAKNGSVTFADLGVITDPSTMTITGLNTINDYYCYKITAEDACGAPPVDSDIICSIALSATAENINNKIAWKTEGNNFTNYEISKDGALLSTILSANTKMLDDPNVQCTLDYCYMVIQNYNNGSRSISSEVCITAVSTDIPDAIVDITGTVVENAIKLDWELPSGFNPRLYFISKSIDGAPFSKIADETAASFTDETVDANNSQYCYTITYIDECNNTAPDGVIVCPVLLALASTTEEAQLNWTNYQGWASGNDEYILEVFDGEENLVGEISMAADTLFLDDLLARDMQVVAYRIKTVSNDGTPKISYSNTVTLTNPIIVFAPNAFSPDGNGLNDVFEVKGRYINSFDLQIFNRWGGLLFQSGDKNIGWDGTSKGAPMPNGTYVYRANITDFMGNKIVKSGSVVLIRR